MSFIIFGRHSRESGNPDVTPSIKYGAGSAKLVPAGLKPGAIQRKWLNPGFPIKNVGNDKLDFCKILVRKAIEWNF